MFNIVTAEIIKKIPHIEGVDENRLPQFLSKTYARIISLRTKYLENELQFDNDELQNDIQKLSLICNTLELFLLKNESEIDKQSVAYVSAIGRKFISMIEKNDNFLSVNYIPSKIYAALLFIISGNFSDAYEISTTVDSENNNSAQVLIKAINLLAGGKLKELLRLTIPDTNSCADLVYAESLLWAELTNGIMRLGESLLYGKSFECHSFEMVYKLSVCERDNGTKDIYVAPFLLALLLQDACKTLLSHSIFNQKCPIGISNESWIKAINRLALKRPILWNNHIQAINSGMLNIGTSSVITFPTGAGKTTLSELKISTSLLRDKSVLYLVPTHSLEYQVSNDLNLLWKEVVGDITEKDGEFSIIGENRGTIMVMTPERCLTLLEFNNEWFDNIGLVVFDEFHLISGSDINSRSFDAMSVVVELFDRFPNADYIFLSAMVSNGQQIVDWIKQVTNHECILLDSLWKPTCQLQGCIVYDANSIRNLKERISLEKRETRRRGPSTKLKRSMQVMPKCLFSLKSVWNTQDYDDYYYIDIINHTVELAINSYWKLSPNCNEVSKQLAVNFSNIGLKTIVFVLQPNYAVSICQKINKSTENNNREKVFNKYKKQIDSIVAELGDFKYSYLSICNSATIHHSNMLRYERYISEQYFKDANGVDIMFATPTVSQGINLPADVVIIAGTKRYDGQKGSIDIEAHDILNAVGRAGRAGYRSQGAAILIPSDILSMDGTAIDSVWMDIKNEIFANGDHCLEIKDPYEVLLTCPNSQNENRKVLKLQSDKSSAIKKLHKTFYASKLTIDGQVDVAKHNIDTFVDGIDFNMEKHSEMENLSRKNGYSIEIIRAFLDKVSNVEITKWQNMTVMELFHIFTDWALCNSNQVNEIFGSAMHVVTAILKKKDGDLLTCDDVKRIFEYVELYLLGKTLESIDIGINGKPTQFLSKARQLSLKVIPNISYACVVFIQVVIMYLEDRDLSDSISDEIRAFASCVKEGVTSFSMLKYKYASKSMRVETHKNYVEYGNANL